MDAKGRLYTGYLTDYTLGMENGELETIALTKAQRWSNKSGGFIPIPGDCFIIPFNKVRNFNLQYTTRNRDLLPGNIVVNILLLLLFSASITTIPYYSYKIVGFWWTVLVVTLFLIASVFICTALSAFISPPQTNNTTKYKTEVVLSSVVLSASIIFWIYLILT